MSNHRPVPELASGPTPGALALQQAGRENLPDVVALQFSAYARNRDLLGLEPLPLQADYNDLFSTHEMWVVPADDAGISAVLILEVRAEDLLIWSVATSPDRQGDGLGHRLLRAAETHARELGRSTLRLYTGATLRHLIDWYGRNGYAIEHVETLSDREIAHMVKHLD